MWHQSHARGSVHLRQIRLLSIKLPPCSHTAMMQAGDQCICNPAIDTQGNLSATSLPSTLTGQNDARSLGLTYPTIRHRLHFPFSANATPGNSESEKKNLLIRSTYVPAVVKYKLAVWGDMLFYSRVAVRYT